MMISMRKPALVSLFLLLMPAAFAVAQERWQARSMTMTQGGIAATSQTLASQIGAQILARGGSVVDAAIASNLALGVTEPMMCGFGGDLFVIHWNAKTGKLTGLNASGWSGKNYTLENLKARGASSPRGIHLVSVPGAIDGFAKMHQKFGKLPWKDLFQPAIQLARDGFPVTEIIQWDWGHSEAKLAADANAKRVFLPNGRAPEPGEIFKNPELAKALELMAAQGPAAFYKGPITDSILKTSKRLGGLLEKEDFAEYSAQWVDPIESTYRGWRVAELPPNGQGIGALMMLNLMERFPIDRWTYESPEAFHAKIEAQKFAYADLRQYVADPKFARVPVEGLLNKAYAAERAKLINPEKAECDARFGMPPETSSRHTIYLSVIDREGNIVSWIQSISDLWGSGVVTDDYGFHLHDRAGGFRFEEGHANSAGPRKRPFHTIIPGFMEKGDEHIGFGIMRGANQPLAPAQFVSNVVDHGMNIQAALEAPRFTRRGAPGCQVQIESRVPQGSRDSLTAKGHDLDVRGEYSGLMGGGQAVMFNSRTKVKFGGSSPRKDGAAIPEPLR
jgi:gamma-glutamyltranspeptidase/glutathione hydrolase